MNTLDELTEAQKSLIVALPYRVGLWVSKSDAVGGDKASAQELEALANILQGFAQDVFGSALVQHVMHETLTHKEHWPEWEQNLSAVPQECRQAYDILRTYTDEKEIKVYVLRLMEIAEAVALAFREYGQKPSLSNTLAVYSAYAQAFLSAKMNKHSLRPLDQFLNVSPQERKTLRQIASALRTQSPY